MSDPNGLCQCGCGKRTRLAPYSQRSKGLVRGQPYRYISGHQSRLSPVEYLVDPATGCWVWQRSCFKTGYGQAYVNGRTGYYAHRVFYERFKGKIPVGYQLDHLCRNKPCVNPAHLEAVTQIENSHRGLKTKLTLTQVQAIRRLFQQGGIRLKELGQQFGISPTHIRSILDGKRWPKSYIYV